MKEYLDEDLFYELKDSMIYLERTQADGRVREGLMGMVDLEDYSYEKGSQTLIRATEKTVIERIPPRLKVRENALLELPHIMILIDDEKKKIIEDLKNEVTDSDVVYDFDLMENGGHIKGYKLNNDSMTKVEEGLEALCDKEYFEKNRPVYKNSINRLSEQLRITLDSEREIFPSMSNHGKINGGKIWQALYVDNPRVFEKKEQEDKSGFSVDIMIDGSSSRKNSQEFIAAQVYVLAKSLERCNIPCQIYSYCSIRGYTVLRIFKDYSEQKAGKEIFKYVAAGNNRDGLALKGAGHLMEHSPKEKRILVVLTDASPQDDQSATEGAFYKNNEYTDELAIKDTEKEIHNLKSNNIQVIGIFMGSERGTIAAKEIFGKDFVKIETIHQFSDAVGRILQEKIRNIN